MKENIEIMTKEEFSKIDRFGIGAPNDAFAKYFIGQSFLKPLTDAKKSEIPIFNVTFEPGCRNNWHVHHAAKGGGQVLICTARKKTAGSVTSLLSLRAKALPTNGLNL